MNEVHFLGNFSTKCRRLKGEMIMATYEMMKRTIIRQKASGALNRSDWQSKLDVFMLFDRITPEQYTELKELIGDSAGI